MHSPADFSSSWMKPWWFTKRKFPDLTVILINLWCLLFKSFEKARPLSHTYALSGVRLVGCAMFQACNIFPVCHIVSSFGDKPLALISGPVPALLILCTLTSQTAMTKTAYYLFFPFLSWWPDLGLLSDFLKHSFQQLGYLKDDLFSSVKVLPPSAANSKLFCLSWGVCFTKLIRRCAIVLLAKVYFCSSAVGLVSTGCQHCRGWCRLHSFSPLCVITLGSSCRWA